MKKIFFFILFSSACFAQFSISWNTPFEAVGRGAICTVECPYDSRCSATCPSGCIAGCYEKGGCYANCISPRPGPAPGPKLEAAINETKQIYSFSSNFFDIDPDVWNWKSNMKFLTLYIFKNENLPNLEINWKLFNEFNPLEIGSEDKDGDGIQEIMLKYNTEDVKNFLGAISSDRYSFFVAGWDLNKNLYIGFFDICIKTN